VQLGLGLFLARAVWWHLGDSRLDWGSPNIFWVFLIPATCFALVWGVIFAASPLFLALGTYRSIRAAVASWRYSITLEEDTLLVKSNRGEARFPYGGIVSVEIMQSPPAVQLGLSGTDRNGQARVFHMPVARDGRSLAEAIANRLVRLHTGEGEAGSA
jgi:hypothetical protein